VVRGGRSRIVAGHGFGRVSGNGRAWESTYFVYVLWGSGGE